jgi:hypothetical protein
MRQACWLNVSTSVYFVRATHLKMPASELTNIWRSPVAWVTASAMNDSAKGGDQGRARRSQPEEVRRIVLQLQSIEMCGVSHCFYDDVVGRTGRSINAGASARRSVIRCGNPCGCESDSPGQCVHAFKYGRLHVLQVRRMRFLTRRCEYIRSCDEYGGHLPTGCPYGALFPFRRRAIPAAANERRSTRVAMYEHHGQPRHHGGDILPMY